MKKHLYTSERLGFRNWSLTDLEQLSAMNSDPKVMEFFPKVYSKEESKDFILRMQSHFNKYDYCYFAVDHLIDKEFIGFIGLCFQDYEAFFTPCVDIGWRLKKSSWNAGYATEGALATLDYAFNKLSLESVYSIAPEINLKSQKIMRKIGMKKLGLFKHSKLKETPNLQTCVVYEIKK